MRLSLEIFDTAKNRELIAKIAEAKEKEIPKVGKLLARLTRVCHLGKKADHTKLEDLVTH